MIKYKERTITIDRDVDNEGEVCYVCSFGWDNSYKLGGIWFAIEKSPEGALMKAINSMKKIGYLSEDLPREEDPLPILRAIERHRLRAKAVLISEVIGGDFRSAPAISREGQRGRAAIKERYNELKSTMSFGEAHELAVREWLEGIL